MPNVGDKETESEFMNRCIPIVIEEGKSKEQAIAICSSVWQRSKK